MVLSCCFNSYFEYQFLWNLLSNIVLGNFQYKWLWVAQAFRVLTESLCLVRGNFSMCKQYAETGYTFVHKELNGKKPHTQTFASFVLWSMKVFSCLLN